MSARHRELLEQLAEEHERLLKECEELRAQQSRAQSAACAQDFVERDSAAGSQRRTSSNAQDFVERDSAAGSQRSALTSTGSQRTVGGVLTSASYPHIISDCVASGPATRYRTKAAILDEDEHDDSDLALSLTWAGSMSNDVIRETPSGHGGRSSLQHAATKIYRTVRANSVTLESMHGQAQFCLQSCVMTPTSRKRQAWDMLCMVVLAYDILVLPTFVFRDDDDPIIEYVDICTTSIWTLDMIINFFTGYYDVGNVEMGLSKIARRYLTTWFMLDCPVVLIDWLTTILFQNLISQLLGLVRVVKVFRIVHCLRMLRLVRLLKLRGGTNVVGSYLRSEFLVTFFAVFTSLGYILALGHYIACGWYFIGGQHRPFTWVQVLDDEGRDTWYRYITALHWSLTQFTPASSEVQPHNFQERVFAVVVILTGMVGFSTFVSRITQAMAHLHQVHKAESEQHARMRRFFIENQISFDVGNRINRFLKERNFTRQSRTYESDVALFAVLPESLRIELHVEMYRPVAATHYFIHHALYVHHGFMEEICHHAMSELSVKRAEELFGPSHRSSEAAFHVRSGAGEYFLQGRKTVPAVGISGKWLCEAVLWLQWKARGRLVAASMLECVALNAEAFGRLTYGKAIPLLVCMNYAREYRRRLVAADDRECLAELGFDQEVQEQMVSIAFSGSDTMHKAKSLAFGSIRNSSPLALLNRSRGLRRVVQ